MGILTGGIGTTITQVAKCPAPVVVGKDAGQSPIHFLAYG